MPYYSVAQIPFEYRGCYRVQDGEQAPDAGAD